MRLIGVYECLKEGLPESTISTAKQHAKNEGVCLLGVAGIYRRDNC